MKLCKDCKHSESPSKTFTHADWKCYRKVKVGTDLVTGLDMLTTNPLDCQTERYGVRNPGGVQPDRCGEDGKYWEAKP